MRFVTLRFPLIGAVALGAVSAAVAQRAGGPVTVITGTLLGADGAPMKLANVQIYRPYTLADAARATVGRNGEFAIATADTGVLALQFSGVDHADARVPVHIAAPTSFAVDVRLKRYVYGDSLDRVQAVGDWGSFTTASARALVRQRDGRYTLDVATTADTLAYQLIGLAAAHGGARSINGPRSDWYVYDNNGDYRSVIRASDGHATVVLDPTQLDRRPSTLSVTFRSPQSSAARLYALYRSWDEQITGYYDSSRAARQRHDSLHYDWAPTVARKLAALDHEHDYFLRTVLCAQLIDAAAAGAHLDSALAERILRELRPSSGAWRLQYYSPQAIWTAYHAIVGVAAAGADSVASLATLAYLDSLVAVQPDSNLQLTALMGEWNIIAGLKDRERRRSDFYERLARDYPYSSFTGFVSAILSPHRAWRDSQPVPAFHFAALDDTSVVYTPASFTGTVYLLDFWATWCGPCVRDMKELHAAYDSLGPRGLVILSISLDNTPADVRRFRVGQWKMPWLHAYEPGGFDDAQMKRLEIFAIPRYALVGRGGTILAVDRELRGDLLLPTLRRALEAPAGP